MKPLQIETIQNAPYSAFVHLWRTYSESQPLRREEENNSRDDEVGHRRVVNNIMAHLRKGQPIPEICTNFPLAILEGLDKGLMEKDQLIDGHRNAPRAIECAGVEYRVLPRTNPLRASQQDYSGHITRWVKHHRIIPQHVQGMTLVLQHVDHTLAARLQTLQTQGVKVTIGSFDDGVTPAWLRTNPPGWSAHALTDIETRWRSVLDCLQQASAFGSDMLVMPELCVCVALRARVSHWLKTEKHPLLLVAPGSFHETIKGKTYNRSVIMDHRGRSILSQCKVYPVDFQNKTEILSPGETVELLESPIGLITLLICRDFCDVDRADFERHFSPDWVLVPSMTVQSGMHAHCDKAKRLSVSCGTYSIIANQPPPGAPTETSAGLVVMQKGQQHWMPPNDRHVHINDDLTQQIG